MNKKWALPPEDLDQVRFRHLKAVSGGVVTIAYKKGFQEEAYAKFTYGIALCSPSDSFNRAKGRFIAVRRMKKLSDKLNIDNGASIVHCILEDMFSLHSGYMVPRWLSKEYPVDKIFGWGEHDNSK